MSVQALLISVAITCVMVGVTFLYFRNRIGKTEQKVDLMFQLIQEHEKNSRMTQQMQMQQMQMHQMVAESNKPSDQENPSNLINISDEEEYDSEDSEEISDSEDEESKLVIGNNDVPDENISNVKTISLSLEGAETSNGSINLSDLPEPSEIANLEENNEINLNDGNSSADDLDELTLTDQENDNETDNDSSDGTLNNFVITKSTQDDTDSNNDNEHRDNPNPDDLPSDDNQIQNESTPTTNYAKLTKTQLKQLAQDKGLVGYNKLTKNGLVDLLSQN